MKEIRVNTRNRTHLVDITKEIANVVRDSGVEAGVVTVFCPHTTGGLTLNENADPDVQTDIDKILDRVVPWTGGYKHGEGNSAAHVKASMMGSSVQIIVEGGKMQLGTWQAIYFCEFDGPRSRKVWITVA
jgi:secondary thiamine-phosphate synthase enzyme